MAVAATTKFDLSSIFKDPESQTLNFTITDATSTGADDVADSLALTDSDSKFVIHGITATVTDTTLAFSGTVANLQAPETILITITANDGANPSPAATLTLSVSAVNEAPVATDSSIAITPSEGDGASTTSFALSTYFTDADSELSFTWAAII